MLRMSCCKKVWAGILGGERSWCKDPGVGLILVLEKWSHASSKVLKTHKPQSHLLSSVPEAVVLMGWALCHWVLVAPMDPHSGLWSHGQGEAVPPSPREGTGRWSLGGSAHRKHDAGMHSRPWGASGSLLWSRRLLSGCRITRSR